MYWHIKSFSLVRLVLITLAGLLSSRILRLWVFLELSTLRFTIYFSVDSFLSYYKEIIKFFFIQALRGMLLILLILSEANTQTLLFERIFCAIMFFKMGSIPFHAWLLKISYSMSWGSLFIFLTLLKILPLQFLRIAKLSVLVLMCFFIFLLSAFLALITSNLKQLVIVSSLFFLGIIFLILQSTSSWLELILIYSTILFPLVVLARITNNSNSFLANSIVSSINRVLLFILLINLTGVPPFAGFFLKYTWLVSTSINFRILLIFFFSSAFMAYMYLLYSFKNLTWLSTYFPGSRGARVLGWLPIWALSLFIVLL